MDRGKETSPNLKTDILTRTKKRKVMTGEANQVKPIHQAQLETMKEAEEQEQERKDELFERWLHSPERTKKWRRKLAKMERAEAAKEEGPLTDMWVQCENPDCLKWRRLTAQQGAKVDGGAPWFCSMNPNATSRACSDPQEDFIQVERMAKRLGIKYIATSLLEGTVVWTKMPGFCRWPGMITTDYNFGVHVYVDADDEPLSYHVEWLGEVHTRGWMVATQITLYGSVDEEKQLEEAAAPDPTRKKKRYHEKKANDKGWRTSFRKQGVKCTIQTAIWEADELMKLSIADRLCKVVFGRASFQPTVLTTEINAPGDGKEAPGDGPEAQGHDQEAPIGGQVGPEGGQEIQWCGQEAPGDGQEAQGGGMEEPGGGQEAPGGSQETPGGRQEVVRRRQEVGRRHQEVARSHHEVVGRHHEVTRRHQEVNLGSTISDVTEEKKLSVPEQPKPPTEGLKKPAPKTKVTPSSSKISSTEALKVAPPSPQPSVTGGEAVRRQLKGETAMINCSNKEEKFTIDVQMYKKNEKAFEHDVRRFMIRNKRPIREELPVWKGVPINLFQLFLAVYDRGGYLEVIDKRQFQQIFREVTGTSVGTGSTTAKHFYERNLYPYELYINNKDYSQCFETQNQDSSAAQRRNEDKSAVGGKKRRKLRQKPTDSVSISEGQAMLKGDINHAVPSLSTGSTHSDNSLSDKGNDKTATNEHPHLPKSCAKSHHDKTSKFLPPHAASAAVDVDGNMSQHGVEPELLWTPPRIRQDEMRHPGPVIYHGVSAMSPMHSSSSQEVPTVFGDDDFHHGGMADHELREIDNMLDQLDSFSTGFYSTNDCCSYFGGEKVEHPLSDGSVQAWSNHFREADSASAYGQPTMPLEGAQVVPEVEEELDYIEL